MSYQYSSDLWDSNSLQKFDQFHIPALENFTYVTRAPFSVMDSIPTLHLNRFEACRLVSAKMTVDYVPNEVVHAVCELDQPAKRLRIGAEFGNPFEAFRPIGKIIFGANVQRTYISFFGFGKDSEYVAPIDQLVSTTALVGVEGLFLALTDKLPLKIAAKATVKQ